MIISRKDCLKSRVVRLWQNITSDGADIVSSVMAFKTPVQQQHCEGPVADFWKPDGWYQQATTAGRAQCSSTGLNVNDKFVKLSTEITTCFFELTSSERLLVYTCCWSRCLHIPQSGSTATATSSESLPCHPRCATAKHPVGSLDCHTDLTAETGCSSLSQVQELVKSLHDINRKHACLRQIQMQKAKSDFWDIFAPIGPLRRAALWRHGDQATDSFAWRHSAQCYRPNCTRMLTLNMCPMRLYLPRSFCGEINGRGHLSFLTKLSSYGLTVLPYKAY